MCKWTYELGLGECGRLGHILSLLEVESSHIHSALILPPFHNIAILDLFQYHLDLLNVHKLVECVHLGHIVSLPEVEISHIHSALILPPFRKIAVLDLF